MEVELSLEPDISVGFNPSECLSGLTVENECESRALLQYSILMRKFKEFAERKDYIDLQLFGSDLKVIQIIKTNRVYNYCLLLELLL